MGSPDGTCRFSAFTRPPFVATCPQGCGGPAPGRLCRLEGVGGIQVVRRRAFVHIRGCLRGGGWGRFRCLLRFPVPSRQALRGSGRGDGRSNVPTPRLGVTHAPGRSPGTCQIPLSSLALRPFVNGNPEKLFRMEISFFPNSSNSSWCGIPSGRPRKGLRRAGSPHASAARAQPRPTRATGFPWGRAWVPAARRRGEKG